ncbi:dihydroneopterin aldolase [Mangrovibacterium diazotrophicum]|uniref:7,8-dihydroneopterin aldolase n=1 Tax=Mangrovibacterium diazotrophicum TaxID=1261403 RepID=A0A419W8K4_9BACT|nr:dihydroneopterin aldolase [Mangrovibacterium diazotrophicum]RKD91785.1 dihydroneopterin aldolase [Mangrovibacterium diazotrophicum]
MPGIIELEGMEFYAYHGHYQTEKQVGAKFIVAATIHTDCTKAGETDQLDDALNYQKIYDIIKEEMAIPSALLEHVCTRILDHIYRSFPTIEKATIKLSKMNPPMGGQLEKVSVLLSR